MIHETLMHLLNNLDSDKEVQFSEMKEFLHPGEVELLQKIIENVSNYRLIMKFCTGIQKVNSMNIILKENEQVDGSGGSSSVVPNEENLLNLRGLYIEAFANGVFSVLGDYKNEIVELENMFLQNPQLPLLYVVGTLEKYQTMFQLLTSIIELLQKENIHGCLLMGRLHRYIDCGIECKEIAAKKITRGFSVIFNSQLCNWIISGDLVDNFNEFFICDGKCADNDFLYPEQLEETSSCSSSAVIDLLKKTRIRRPPLVRKFYINWKMVPMFINEDTAESILFMGRIVWVLKNDPRKNHEDHYQTKIKKDIWDGEEIEYYKKVQAFDDKKFDEKEFQDTIEECRLKITRYLWSIMLDEGNLKEHLYLIRDYYALGRGELFHQFLTIAEDHIQDISLDHNVKNLNNIFLETARKIYGDNDKTYLRFELTASKSETSSVNPWSRLKLNFDISWPLHIIFHPKSIELYNNLFTYLLRLSKTQIHLQKLWLLHASSRQKIDRRVWALRQHLTFLVNNLQYYLQVDVIEAQFSLLLKAVENANEFGDIIKVHHQFISNLLAKTFVLTPNESHIYESKHKLHQMPAVQFNVPSKVYNVIIRLLNLCDEFCLFASAWDSELTEPEVVELENFQKRTDTTVECLLFILNMHYQKSNQEYLVQLLHQLDFNQFFSKNKPNFNLTASA